MPHSVEAMVSRQVRRWEVARKARERRAAPCVAMSRLPYSGGAELARCLAERLDYGLFDKEIIEGLDVLRIKPFPESNYFEHVVRTISALAEQGMAVIVGRGAPFIVRADRALRLLVVAPDEFRTDRLASQRGLTAQDAQAALREE